MSMLEIRVWDVGHGLSVWIKTPNGQNHWIDAGYNPDGDFSPGRYVYQNYEHKQIDLLCISHPDKDHYDDLHNLINFLGKPRVLIRNKTLPDDQKYGDGSRDYQRSFIELDKTYNNPVDFSICPTNQNNNGGIQIEYASVGWGDVFNKNDTSIVLVYRYRDIVFVFPGDIEEKGWNLLLSENRLKYSSIINNSRARILIAPHHGRGSGYTQSMFDFFQPSLTVISDQYGREPTDNRFRTNPTGLEYKGHLLKFVSTKTNGRALFIVDDSGLSFINSES